MKLKTSKSNDPVFSPEKASVEKKNSADIQIIGGAQYFKTPLSADCGLTRPTFSIMVFG
jgi:hypothetical protein